MTEEIIPYPGIIFHNDGTKTLFKGKEYTDYPPPCPDCGNKLTRGDISKQTAALHGIAHAIFSYQCYNQSCKDKRYAALETMTDKTAVLNKALKRANVPEGYMRYTFDSFIPKEKSDKLRQLIVKFAKTKEATGLLFYGSRGTGKTHGCIAALRELCSRGIDNVLYKNYPELLSDARDNDTIKERALYEIYSKPYILVLDDLGAEKTSEFSIQIVYNILDRRIRETNKTIIATNLDPDDIITTLGERIYSRVQEYQPIMFSGDDKRKKRKIVI